MVSWKNNIHSMLVVNCLLSLLLIPTSLADRAILTIVDRNLWVYIAETLTTGNQLFPHFLYHATIMLPPDESELCSFPPSLLSYTVNGTSDVPRTPIALLVKLGGCDPTTQAQVALEIHNNVTSALDFVIFYDSDSDSDNPKDIDIDPIDGMENLAFVSVGASSADSILERINKYTNTEEEEDGTRQKSPVLFDENNDNWNLQMFLEVLEDNYRTSPPLPDDDHISDFYWFRLTLFTLLIVSPCCRAVYLWWIGGGRIRLRRNEAGDIIGLHYTPAMSYWFATHGVPHDVPIITDTLTEEEVLALPEIVYNKRLQSEEGDDHDQNNDPDTDVPSVLMLKSMESNDVTVASGSSESDQEAELSNKNHQGFFGDEEEAGRQGGLTTSCTMCSICIDEFEYGERIRLLPRCGHAFHTECILPWLRDRQGCCPLCKSNVLQPEHGDQPESNENLNDFQNLTTPDTSIINTDRGSNVGSDANQQENVPTSNMMDSNHPTECQSDDEKDSTETSAATATSESSTSPDDEQTSNNNDEGSKIEETDEEEEEQQEEVENSTESFQQETTGDSGLSLEDRQEGR